MLYSTRSKLIFSFLSVALLVGAVSLIVGWQLLYDSVLNEANNRVRQDLNVARVIYDDRVMAIELSLTTTVLATDFIDAALTRNLNMLKNRMELVALGSDLDFAGIISADHTVLCRITSKSFSMVPMEGPMPIAEAALKKGRTVSGTVVLDPAILGTRETRLAIASAVPIIKNGKLIGTIYGGMFLNGDVSMVDKINETVFRNEVYHGQNLGTATIFFKDLRISTNVLGDWGQSNNYPTLKESAVTVSVFTLSAPVLIIERCSDDNGHTECSLIYGAQRLS